MYKKSFRCNCILPTMFLNQMVFYICAIFIAFVRTYPYENSIKWAKAPESEILLLNLVPVGLENNIKLFLCRIHYEGNTVAGKLYIENGITRCKVPYRNSQFLTPEFEVLVTFPEVVSWKPFRGTIDENMIYSGKMDGERSYICRARVKKGDLIPGRLDGATKTCHLAIDGHETTLKEPNFECLGRNFLGITMNTIMPAE